MQLGKVTLLFTLCVLVLAGCKKEEPVETTVPMPEYIEDTSVVFSCYGDSIVFNIEGEEAIQSKSDIQLILLPDRTKFDTVSIDYIQGNSLNDYGMAYWEGLEDDTKSDYKDNSFITSTHVYVFDRKEGNSFIMVKGPVVMKEYCLALIKRF